MNGAQADSVIGESAFLDCFNRAVINAGSAVYADISVDDILLVAFSNSLNGAVICTATALNASISNNVSHDFPSNYVYSVAHSYGVQIYFNTISLKCNCFFKKQQYKFLDLWRQSPGR